eukprot:CAMPEP_0181335606 /NCGR_PEP_ID=MMETSP1101-20121128/26933_1 /TAXON_ID=46948 /ORGANISM="Rhodomonas abbreviata, Strain Caron Lab Isolate" /LENGTH=607 /DNA_ID=CAMNT_0023445761 /DNA_START=6 /DNA_END=1826 /DNA_ORIENTATION=+
MAGESAGRASYGATGAAAPLASSTPDTSLRGALRLSVVGVALLSMLAAHCMAGCLYYGGASTLLSISPGALEQGLRAKWASEVEPSTSQLESDALAILRAQKSLKHAKASYAGVEAAADKVQGLGAPVELLQHDETNSVDSLGLDVPSLKHFEKAEAHADYYQRRGRYNRLPSAASAASAAEHKPDARTKLLDPNSYPAPGYPFDQQSVDTALSNGPARTFDTKALDTCPSFIPNCNPQLNTLKECDFSCGAYCQAVRADGPCFSGDAEGEWSNCKFGYRGAPSTPSVTDKDESGWLEARSHWGQGGPTDCMTCPVGFKIMPLYGDGTGRCEPCAEGWVDAETGLITEPGCGGAQYVSLDAGEEPGQHQPSEHYATVAGCFPQPQLPVVGALILAKIPDDEKETPFFADYPADYYPAQVMGVDGEDSKLSVEFADGGPLLPLAEGLDAAALGDDYVPLPALGDKVTLSQEYWDECCTEAWDAAVSGPLRLGDVGEVSSVLPPEANDPSPYTVMAPNGERWMYGAGQVLRLVGEVRCPLSGYLHANTVGDIANKVSALKESPGGEPEGWDQAAPEDPECCCCGRDLWVGCWGWCGDGTTEGPQLAKDT